ncbi:aldehyde dehydrogenase family protein [Paracoccus albus]|uniref:aldehyde dehydrogenase family protein n=1 Tax=Paracoccus albus TaxID=3017784 RepID=UPI0022F0DE70|nr:aldehyde dehydrogenase family protein [Paracoccus albus]WBU59928.1 aldehyde dehydrogenase family protein [Paracoccus albus]
MEKNLTLLSEQHEQCVVLDRLSPARGGSVAVTDKATGETLFTAGVASVDDVNDAVKATAAAQKMWASRSPVERSDVLREFARLCHLHQDEIGGWIVRETGSIPAKGVFEVQTSARDALFAASLTDQPNGHILASPSVRESKARRVPLGVVGVITPWNSPFVLAARVIMPAIAMGNGCVLKPDIQTPISGGYLIARLVEMAGAPPGLVSVVPGEGAIGKEICTNPGINMISFTGSTQTGRNVSATAGQQLKKVSLELGGNNAAIVFPDCDLAAVASATAFGSFFHQGQICFTIGRHLVHEDVRGAYLKLLTEKAARLHVGNPATEQVHLGPMINRTQADRARDILVRSISAGAELSGGDHGEGAFMKPIVVDRVTADMSLFREEIFGPVAPITTFRNEDEAVNLANAVADGLVTSVFTDDIGRALRVSDRLRTGIVHINDQTVVHEAFAPIGGMGTSGNGARSGGPSVADEYSQWQWITVNHEVPEYPF